MATVQMAGNGFGGVVEGNYGTYTVAADGTFTVDSRDVSSMLVLGMTFVQVVMVQYSTQGAPSGATIGTIINSGALSNGSVAINGAVNIIRPLNFEFSAGTAAITAGTATLVYTANDGTTQTDVFSLVSAANVAVTQGLSKGVMNITSCTISGLVGGGSPWLRVSTTTAISLPVSKGATDLVVYKEYDGAFNQTAGPGSMGVSLGSIFPQNAPNGTFVYGFVYSYLATGS